MGIEALMRGSAEQMTQSQRLMGQQGLAGSLLSEVVNSQLGMATTSSTTEDQWSTGTSNISAPPVDKGGLPMDYFLTANGSNPVMKWSGVKPQNRIFYRINQKVELREGEAIKEPLDELRIEVANWLN